jgi:hypothetical protein
MKVTVTSIATEEQLLAAITARIMGGKWSSPLCAKTIEALRAKGVSEERLKAIQPFSREDEIGAKPADNVNMPSPAVISP